MRPNSAHAVRRLKLTPKALAHAEVLAARDEMTLQKVCTPPSTSMRCRGRSPFEVEQTRDLIVFRYEYLRQVRLICHYGREHPAADAPPQWAIRSCRWTERNCSNDPYPPSTIPNNGPRTTAHRPMVELYKLNPDGPVMATQCVADPDVLENNGARYIEWRKHPAYIYPYECYRRLFWIQDTMAERTRLLPSREWQADGRIFTRIALISDGPASH